MTKQDARYLAQTVNMLTVAQAVTPPPPDGAWRNTVDDAMTLHRIAGSLHRYDERVCSEDLGCRKCDGNGYTTDAASEDVKHHPAVTRKACRACGGTGSTVGKRVASLEAKAAAIATAYGFRAYFQGDCRGCPLYLIAESSLPDAERLADIQAGDAAWTMVNRWIESNYSGRGHAVPWLG